tara:strand:+ start:576 stop:1166 length:591 start_codon:yes stop_codon:yes gene_type:complete
MDTKKINQILILICLILLFIVSLQRCNNSPLQDEIISTTTVVDTTRVTHIDTIPFYNIIDSVRWVDLPVISETVNTDSTEFTYTTEVSDSLIDGKINTVVTNEGELVNQGFTYLPKFPKYIIKTDSIFVNKETTTLIKRPEWQIYGGVMVSPVQNFSVIGSIGLKTKKDTYYELGYDPINKNIFGGVKFKLFKSKK